MSTEFMAGVIAGAGLGWLLDRWLGTSPWGLIVFFLLGFGAGIYNVMRVSGFTGARSRTGHRAGSKPPGT
jgi:ATP synthase protein I